MNIKQIEHKIQSYEISPRTSKMLMLIKAGGLKLIDIINNKFYKKPQWDIDYKILFELTDNDGTGHYYNLSALANIYEKEFKFDNGVFINSINWDGTINKGDELLFNGIYSVYNSIFGDGQYFEILINNFISYSYGYEQWFLYRNQNWLLNTTGDQLTGFLWACSEYKKKNKTLPIYVEQFLNRFINTKEFNENQECNYKPNILSINGDCLHYLTACAVAGRWDVFEKFYEKYGYKYMLPYGSIYLFDDRYKYGNRNWFSCNIALISLCIMWREVYKTFGFKVYHHTILNNIEVSVLKILNNNKHNLFFWLLALHYGVITKNYIPQKALSYFETFIITEGVKDNINNRVYPPTTYTGSLMPLGLSKANWIWEREPYQIHNDNQWVSHLDMVFTQKLKEKYNI